VILKELPPDHRIEFYHEVFNDAGKLLTTGRVVLYFMDAKNRRQDHHAGTDARKGWRRSLAERSKWAKRSCLLP